MPRQRKAQWSAAPVVHITSRRFVQRTEPVTRIKIYSNASSVEISLNGEPIGSAPCVDRVCTREGVTLVAGENRIAASAAFGTERVKDSVSWTLQAP